jgi:hypothetical protein
MSAWMACDKGHQNLRSTVELYAKNGKLKCPECGVPVHICEAPKIGEIRK